MIHKRSLFIAALVAGAPLVARAQPAPQILPDVLADDAKESVQNITVNDSPEARKDIETAHGMERQKEWLKAAGWYQQVLEKYRTRVVAWKANDQNVIDRYRGIVYEVQQSLAKWPPEGIKAYRSRYESSAAQALAAAPDDLTALNNVLEIYFVTEAGKTAGMKLIDLHMEAGEFDAAARIGELLLEYYPTDHLIAERPRILFRTALAHHFCGDNKAARARADELKQKFADATGSIFGKDAVLAQSLEDLMKAAPVTAQNNAPDAWAMFSGSPDRSHVSSAIGHTGARIASIPLPPRGNQMVSVRGPVIGPFNGRDGTVLDAAGQAQADEDKGMLLGVMPVVDSGELFFQDGAHVWARSLDSGFPLVGWAQTYAGNDNTQGIYQIRNAAGPVNIPPQRGGQYTLTLTNNAVLGVMGQPLQPGIALQMGGALNRDFGTRLVCLDRATGKEKWRASPLALTGDTLKDEDRDRLRSLDLSGSPVVVGDNVYVIGRGGKDAQFENCYVLCFDLTNGKYRWSCLVASANSGNGGMVNGGQLTDFSNTLSHLAYAGGRLYVNTNLGALAAIDAYNGSIVWLSLYRRDTPPINDNIPVHWNRPRQFFTQQPQLRPWEYNPVLAQDGKLFVLPLDSKFLLIFDAANGKELKAIDLSEFQQDASDIPTPDRPRALVAVHDGLVYLTGSEHVYTVNWSVYDTSKSFLDNVPAGAIYSELIHSKPRDFIRGRAFVTADSVIVTTDKALSKLNPRKGLLIVGAYPSEGRQQWDEEIEGPGNVIATGEHVIIAGAHNVNVYTDMTIARAKHDKAVAAAPNDVTPRLEYAKIMFAAGQAPVALEKMTEAINLLGGIDRMRPGADRQQIFSDAWTFAQRLATEKRGEANDAAVKFYDLAAAAADLPKEQVTYRIFRARFCRENRDAHSLEQAVQLYQEILSHAEWRTLSVPSTEEPANPGATIQAGILAQREIADLKSKHPEAYAVQEKKAIAAMEEAKAASDPAKLLAVATDYPNADAAPKAMLAAAELNEKAGNARQATHILRKLFRNYGETTDKPLILESMARNYLSLPGGLDIAIARLQRAKGFGDARITQPLKLPGGQTLADVSFKDVLAAMIKARPTAADAAASLIDLHVPDRHAQPKNDAVPLAAFLPANDPRSVVIKDVTALLQPEDSPMTTSRRDRIVAAMRENKVALFVPGQVEPLGISSDFTDAPQHAVWTDANAASPDAHANAMVWSRNEVIALDGSSAKTLWKYSIKPVPGAELAAAPALDGIEIVNDTSPANVASQNDVVIINGNARFIQRRGFRGVNNFGRVQVAGLAPVEEQPPAPNTPEQLRHVMGLNDRVIVGTSSGRVICLAAADGKVLWQAKVGTRAIDKLLANDDFSVARVTEDGAVRLIVLDNFDGQIQTPVRSFPTNQGIVPQNIALSPEGTLVWTTPDRLCGKDLYAPGKALTFEFPAHGAGDQPVQDLNANGIRQFNGVAVNPALTYAGCTRDNQLLIHGDRILTVEEGGAYVVAHSLETGKPLVHVDKEGRQIETRLSASARGGTTQAPNSAEVNLSISTAGPYLYLLGPRSLICYNLDHPTLDQWFETPVLSGNPNYQVAVPTKSELLVISEPSHRRPADDLGAPVKQLRLYDRRQVKDEGEGNQSVESGIVDYIQNVNDPSGIKSWQVVDGGLYYLAGDQTLHFLVGSK